MPPSRTHIDMPPPFEKPDHKPSHRVASRSNGSRHVEYINQMSPSLLADHSRSSPQQLSSPQLSGSRPSLSPAHLPTGLLFSLPAQLAINPSR